jgi:hypothetical protein
MGTERWAPQGSNVQLLYNEHPIIFGLCEPGECLKLTIIPKKWSNRRITSDSIDHLTAASASNWPVYGP